MAMRLHPNHFHLFILTARNRSGATNFSFSDSCVPAATFVGCTPRVPMTACSKCLNIHLSSSHWSVHARLFCSLVPPQFSKRSLHLGAGSRELHFPRTAVEGIKVSFISRKLSTAARESSTLFVSALAEDASNAPVQIDLGLESRLSEQNVGQLQKNVAARQMDFNLEQFLSDYKVFQDIDRVKANLIAERTDTAGQMAVLVKNTALSAEELSKQKCILTSRGKDIKEQLRKIMPSWYEAEEKVMLKALKLPADLHPDTPEDGDKVRQSTTGTIKTPEFPVSHLVFAERVGLLKFSNVGPRSVYLLGDAADLEMTLIQLVMAKMQDGQLLQVACPEIFRSVIVEGCGFDPKSAEQILTLQQRKDELMDANVYHLVGTSLLSYAAYLARVQVRGGHLPLRMFSLGRHYQPPCSRYPGLYGAVQSNRVTMFSACRDASEASDMYSQFMQLSWDTVSSLGLQARLVSVSPPGLRQSESQRSEVQVWAPSLQRYITVGGVSCHSDFVSRRLMCRQHPSGHFLHMVSGIAMDITRVLASTLEHSFSQGTFQLPQILVVK